MTNKKESQVSKALPIIRAGEKAGKKDAEIVRDIEKKLRISNASARFLLWKHRRGDISKSPRARPGKHVMMGANLKRKAKAKPKPRKRKPNAQAAREAGYNAPEPVQ